MAPLLRAGRAQATLLTLTLLTLALLAACAAPVPVGPVPADAVPAAGAPAAASPATASPAAAVPAAATTGPATPEGALPEGATAWRGRDARTFLRHAVSAAHPLAAEAGLATLRAGGNALDAAIATAFALAVVEPQSSGLGGGALLLHWDGRRLQAWDGRETAPAAAGERLFLDEQGQPLPFAEARHSGLSVGVPGAVAAWAAAHRAGGRLPWPRLVAPALALARGGFAVSPRLHRALAEAPWLRSEPRAAALFFHGDGRARAVGERIVNPALAAALERVAAEGAHALRRGPLAEDLLARVRGHARRPGAMNAADLAGYQPLAREPLCAEWRLRWHVCGFPPPSSGALAVMQLLGQLDVAGHVLWPVAGEEAADPVAQAAWIHAWTESMRLAFADRARHLGDPAFVAAPGGDWHTLLAPAYLRERAGLIAAQRRATMPAGVPAAPGAQSFATMPESASGGTTHLSVVDGEGGVVALTASVEASFGAGLWSDGGSGLPGGYPLNNQLTDFSFAPADAQGRLFANRVQPGKRPRSSMSPTIVFDRASGEPVLVLGSALGPFIIPAVARVMAATLEGGVELGEALAAPMAAGLDGPLTLLEAGRFDAATQAALRARGHRLHELPLASGLHALQRVPGGWRAAADPRRDGEVRGD